MIGFHVLIPARFASTRLPAKALADIAGKPMVVRVAERAARSRAASVHVATDHGDIAAACREHGVPVLMTRADHPTGTDRLAEAAVQLGLDAGAIVVNVQGDEPLVPVALVDAVARALAEASHAAIATACHAIEDMAEFLNPNVVKVLRAASGEALAFSRAPMPWPRDLAGMPVCGAGRDTGAALPTLPEGFPAWRHIGMYAYRVGFLHAFRTLPPAPIEQAESLEQLRALWHGHRIVAVIAPSAPPAGVDTPADLERVRAWFDRHGQSS